MKKILSAFLCIFFISTLLLPINSYAAYNSSLDFESEIAVLVSLDDSSYVFDKNADMRSSPASLTKIVTALVALENTPDLDIMVTAPEYTIRLLDGTDSSNAGISGGEQLSMKDLIACMLIQSANEASNIIAHHIGGTIKNFVDLMNAYVENLGCKNTHFMNAHGLDEPNQYSTANDMIIIAKQALKSPVFMELSTVTEYFIPATNLSPKRELFSTNFLTKKGSYYYYEYAKGLKTGTTDSAGRCIISTASKDGYNYLAVVMRGPYKDVDNDGEKENTAFLDCRNMFKWTFSNIKLRLIASSSQTVATVKLNLSRKVDQLRLVPSQEISALIPAGVDTAGVLIEPIAETMPESVDAPVKKGDIICRARILYADTEIRQIDLVAAEDVDTSVMLYIGNLLKAVFSSLIFKIVASIGLILILFYALLFIIGRSRRKKRRPRVIKDYRNLR